MSELNTKNTLIISIAVGLCTITAILGISLAVISANEDSSRAAIACSESGGTWIQASGDCIAS